MTGWKKAHSSAGSSVTQNGPSDLNPTHAEKVTVGTKKDSEAEKKDHNRTNVSANGLQTEDDVYAFLVLKGRLSNRLWRYVPFLPPNMIQPDDATFGHGSRRGSNTCRSSSVV